MSENEIPIGFDEMPPDEREVNMKELETIQTENRLNDVFALGERGPGGARHVYQVFRQGALEGDTLLHRNMDMGKLVLSIEFNGPRNEPGSMRGVTDADLLEIVRDRLTDFQAGPYPSPETADALRYVTEALLCMNRRTQDRAQRGVLGKNTP